MEEYGDVIGATSTQREKRGSIFSRLATLGGSTNLFGPGDGVDRSGPTRYFREPTDEFEAGFETTRRRGTAPSTFNSSNKDDEAARWSTGRDIGRSRQPRRRASVQEWYSSWANPPGEPTSDRLLRQSPDRDLAESSAIVLEEKDSTSCSDNQTSVTGPRTERVTRQGDVAETHSVISSFGEESLFEAIIEHLTPENGRSSDSELGGPSQTQQQQHERTGDSAQRKSGWKNSPTSELQHGSSCSHIYESGRRGSHERRQGSLSVDNPPDGHIDDSDGRTYRTDDKSTLHVSFLSTTMGMTVDIDNSGDHKGDTEVWPASPCSGTILESSPRYGSLQTFRKELSVRGIDVQMYYSGWKGSLLPPRNIRLFMTDARKDSILYWRYKKRPRRTRQGAKHIGGALGAEDRRTISLRAMANIGPAELDNFTAGCRGRTSLWSLPSFLRRRGSMYRQAQGDTASGKVEQEGVTTGFIEAVPVLALSYWAEGEPRWVGDKPKRLLVKPDSLYDFRRLTDGLRLCCLHFHNYACPQDLEDTL